MERPIFTKPEIPPRENDYALAAMRFETSREALAAWSRRAAEYLETHKASAGGITKVVMRSRKVRCSSPADLNRKEVTPVG